MTSLLEMKQNLKAFYGKYEIYILPVLKFALALIYFMWINRELGFSGPLSSIFVVLVLALLCAILPTNAIVLFGFLLIIGHCYSVGIEVAGVAAILILLMYILFLRFSSQANLALMFCPIGFMLRIPIAVPVGAGLLGSALTAAPAACGVILYYFVKVVNEQAAVLQGEDTEIIQKIRIILDGIITNQEMWVTVIAFVVVLLLVYLLRTRSMDYAWRIAVIIGVVVYVFFMIAGGLFLDMDVNMVPLIIAAVVSMLIGFLLEFFAFGGDYTRIEQLEYEDDDYYYYVKAVPKASVSTSSRRIKKINAQPEKKEFVTEEIPPVGDNDIPVQDVASGDVPISQEIASPQQDIDFEKKLEESLKDL